jgi:hypothetical protein
MHTIATVTGIVILATLAESLIEYLIRPLVKPWVEGDAPTDRSKELAGLALRYFAAALGVVLSVLYKADLLALVGLDSPIPIVGYILTGLIIGRGSNFVHDFASRWLSPTGAVLN